MAKIKRTMTVSLEEFGKKAGEYALDEFEYNGLTIRQWADKITSGEYQPVKHGRWETWGYIFHGIAWKRCSVCGKTADLSYQALLDGKIEMATPSICGCCGCRMDGDSE